MQLLLWVGSVDIAAAAAVRLCTVVLLVGHVLGSTWRAWDFISKVSFLNIKVPFSLYFITSLFLLTWC